MGLLARIAAKLSGALRERDPNPSDEGPVEVGEAPEWAKERSREIETKGRRRKSPGRDRDRPGWLPKNTERSDRGLK